MTTTIKEIFKNDITRTIDGVIKAGDESHIVQEVEEYVITKEINRYLRTFVELYIKSIEEGPKFPLNGVWISGYFGSGKSHLLKILALVLANRIVNGISLKDIFLRKIDDAVLRADFEKIIQTPSTSILFNIEQVAETVKNESIDPVLSAFVRMFNRMRGYYEDSVPLANFERDMDEEGKLKEFKEYYRKKNKETWENDRSKALLLKRNKFMETLAAFKGFSREEAGKIIDSYEKSYSLTIDGFCKEVKKWLDSQPHKKHRINFFVDEVGQFIADNTKYLLSLQTIVEAIGTETGARTWIFVTSQEAIDKIIGDKSQEQGPDLSKITARYPVRISLSSADVREVIQHRLLEKNEKGIDTLKQFYKKEKENIKTIFGFQEGWKNIQYKDEDDFIYSYPFPAYQFDLLHEALHGLGSHNAFIGKHVAHGERTMIEIFQLVGKTYKDKSLYAFAPFDAMYDGIQNTLNTGLIMAIHQAEHNLPTLAVRILKALLLVKYVQGFKSTFANLKILLCEDIHTDIEIFSKQLQDTLIQLEREIYLRRTGDTYEYLTNEEQDAEREIHNINSDYSKHRKFIEEYLFGEVLKSNKIRYEKNGEDYAYQKAIDEEHPKGQGELVIRIVTPWHPDAGNKNIILTKSMGRKELTIFLPQDHHFMDEVELYYKTDTWLKQIDTNSPKYARIIADKRAHNEDRRKNLREALKRLLLEADLAVFDTDIEVRGATAQERISDAFQKLILRSYPNLQMIKTRYTQESLEKILRQPEHYLEEHGDTELTEPEKEMLNFIQQKYAIPQSITLAKLKDEFRYGSYGWPEWAILCIVALLFSHQHVELARATEPLSREELFEVLKKGHGHDTVIIKLTPKLTVHDMERLKRLHYKLFHKANDATNPKECGNNFRNALSELILELKNTIQNAPDFPFMQTLHGKLKELESLGKKEWSYFLKSYDEYASSLQELIENTIEHAISFLKGPNVETWKKIDTWLKENEDNLYELEMPDAIKTIKNCRESINLYKTSETKHAKDLWEALAKKQKKLFEELQKKTFEQIQESHRKLFELSEWEQAPQEVKETIEKRYKELEDRATQVKSFGSLRDIGITQTNETYNCALNLILNTTKDDKIKKTKIEYIPIEQCKIAYNKPYLSTTEEVEEYSNLLYKKWKEIIESGKRIKL